MNVQGEWHNDLIVIHLAKWQQRGRLTHPLPHRSRFPVQEHLGSLLSQVHNTMLSTIAATLCVKFQELLHLSMGSSYPFTSTRQYHPHPPCCCGQIGLEFLIHALLYEFGFLDSTCKWHLYTLFVFLWFVSLGKMSTSLITFYVSSPRSVNTFIFFTLLLFFNNNNHFYCRFTSRLEPEDIKHCITNVCRKYMH